MTTETMQIEPQATVESLRPVPMLRPDEADGGIRGVVTAAAAGALLWLVIGALFFL